VEIRNEADSLTYRVERQLKDFGDRVPVHEKARIEQILSDLKTALKEKLLLLNAFALCRVDLQQVRLRSF